MIKENKKKLLVTRPTTGGNIILSNETIVTTIGEVKNPDGSSVTLEDGQYVDQKGEIGEWKEK